MELDNLRPMTVNHENSKLYSMLKQSMANNEELRQALLDAAQTIEKLTQQLVDQNENR